MEIINKIIESIEQYDKIILLRHILPDGDAYGSQLGLKDLIKTNYPHKEVYAFGEEVGYLKFVGEFDQVADHSIFNNALVIVTDCGNVERIDNQHYNQGSMLIKIDHHPDATPYGHISWVDTSYTSASEMIGYLAIQANWTINASAARVIYHGICTDSGRFMFGGITPRTFEVCAQLLKSNFDIHHLYKTMYQRTFESIKLQSEVMQTAKVSDHRVGYLILTDEVMQNHNLSYDDNGRFSNALKDIKGIDIWITFSAREDKSWRVEFRSNELAINDLAVKWGGGGHKLASGAIIDDLEQAMQIIKDADNIIIEHDNQK